MNSHSIPPISNFIKKRGKNTRGGTRRKPSKKKQKSEKTEKKGKKIIKTTAYGNLNRGIPQRSE